MRVLGVVTARGGSKGIPRKNLTPLLGKPLLAYTAEAALAASRLTRVVLSTDDPEIAQFGCECGLEVPFLRPAELARDETPTVPVLQHAVKELEAAGDRYDAILVLQPTNPLRRPEDIDGSIELLEQSGADSVISLVDTGGRHPARMKYVTEDGTVEDPPFVEAFEGQRRQSLPAMYLREGSIYLTRRNVLMNQNSLKGKRCMAWIVPEERACNIDTPFDLFVAEQILLRSHADRAVTRQSSTSGERAEIEFRSRPTILVAESANFSPQALEILNVIGKVITADLDRAELLRSVPEADVLWVRLRNRIDAEVMAAAPRLQCILSATTGLNHIDTEEARRRSIEVLSLRGETSFLRDVHATAEHTVGLMLALLRRLPSAARHAAEGGWNRDLFRGRELYGKTVGIVGFGRLGTMIAPLVRAFGARVLFADPKASAGAMAIEELLKRADIVTLHVNLTADSRCFFGRAELQAMQRGSWLINTSRGELIEETALVQALESGHLAGAALDVLSGEGNQDLSQHPLVRYARDHDNLILTPHIAGCTTESMEKTETYLAEKFQRLVGQRTSKAESARV